MSFLFTAQPDLISASRPQHLQKWKKYSARTDISSQSIALLDFAEQHPTVGRRPSAKTTLYSAQPIAVPEPLKQLGLDRDFYFDEYLPNDGTRSANGKMTLRKSTYLSNNVHIESIECISQNLYFNEYLHLYL
jgi:hypothetical protein